MKLFFMLNAPHEACLQRKRVTKAAKHTPLIKKIEVLAELTNNKNQKFILSLKILFYRQNYANLLIRDQCKLKYDFN